MYAFYKLKSYCRLLLNGIDCCKIYGIENSKLFRSVSLSLKMVNKKVKCDESKQINSSIPCDKKQLDLGITLKGGQSFRWETCNEDKNLYRGVFSNTVWTLLQNENKLTYNMHGSLKKTINCDELLFNYFRLDVPLDKHIKDWANCDPHFKTSYDKIGAVRMLNQDIVENLFSFICSSNNNIVRISGMVEKLCRLFGDIICTVDEKEYHDFPKIEALADPKVEAVLRKEGFGYRAGYIVKSAEKLLHLGGREWLEKLHKDNGSTYEHARESLMTLPGIGPKVADCISLMSLGHLEAIPVDTHIFQVACASYTPHLSHHKTVTPKIHEEINSHLRNLWGPLAGWAQTIVFCDKINSTENKKKKKRSHSPTKKSVTNRKAKKNSD